MAPLFWAHQHFILFSEIIITLLNDEKRTWAKSLGLEINSGKTLTSASSEWATANGEKLYGKIFSNFSSVQFSRSVVSDSLRPHESQHARPPCPSPTPGVHSDSCPLSLWCHPAISSSVVPFSSCPQSLPASESFPMSQLFAWGGQSIGVSALASVLTMNTQDWSPCSPRDSWESSPTPQFKSINSPTYELLNGKCLVPSLYFHLKLIKIKLLALFWPALLSVLPETFWVHNSEVAVTIARATATGFSHLNLFLKCNNCTDS